jgi:O-antigen ligase
MSRFRPPLSPTPASAPRAATMVAVPVVPAKPAAPIINTPVESDGKPGFIPMLLGAYLAMFMVPIAELATRGAGFYVPVMPVTLLILTVALVSRGQIGRFWKTPIAKPWMLLLAMFLAAAALGTYKTLSTVFILGYGARVHLVPFYCCAFLVTTRQVRAGMYWICSGALLLLAVCAILGTIEDGRFLLPNTSLANPNDLAFYLLLGATCLLLFLYTNSPILRVVWALAFPLSIFFILRTGSRANFVTLILLVPVLFTMISNRAKLIMFALTPVAAVIFAIAIPGSTLERLTTILIHPTEASVSDLALRGAVGSQIARMELQKHAVELTMHHPLMGVGALMFQSAVEEMVHSESGRKSGWEGAHNTYLEISAENGIPALIFYVWVLILCLRMNYASYKACKRALMPNVVLGQSVCLFLMTVGYCIAVTFCNAGYDPHLDVLVALSTANFLAVRREAPPALLEANLVRA